MNESLSQPPAPPFFRWVSEKGKSTCGTWHGVLKPQWKLLLSLQMTPQMTNDYGAVAFPILKFENCSLENSLAFVYNFWESSTVLYKVCQNKNRLKTCLGSFEERKKSVNKHKQRINLTLPRLKFRSEFSRKSSLDQVFCKIPLLRQRIRGSERALLTWKSNQAANIK